LWHGARQCACVCASITQERTELYAGHCTSRFRGRFPGQPRSLRLLRADFNHAVTVLQERLSHSHYAPVTVTVQDSVPASEPRELETQKMNLNQPPAGPVKAGVLQTPAGPVKARSRWRMQLRLVRVQLGTDCCSGVWPFSRSGLWRHGAARRFKSDGNFKLDAPGPVTESHTRCWARWQMLL
jgi:hypothetical protein